MAWRWTAAAASALMAVITGRGFMALVSSLVFTVAGISKHQPSEHGQHSEHDCCDYAPAVAGHKTPWRTT